MAKVRKGSALRHFVLDHFGLIPFLVFALFPAYFMILTAFKQNGELYDLDAIPFWLRQGPTLDHFRFLFGQTQFLHWLLNSVLVAVVATGASFVISVMAAYSLARLRYRGVNFLGTAIFVIYLVPPTLLFLPLGRVIYSLGLADNVVSLMITYPTFLIPFSTWLLMGYFRTVPREIEECAMVDGCGRIGALIRVVLPVTVPGLVCAILFSFTLSWNEFIYALTFISQSTQKTATVGVAAELVRGDVFHWGEIMAGASTGSLPIVLIYAFFLDYYVAGLTAGSVKG
jgi:multiple sugar transport system permease protein